MRDLGHFLRRTGGDDGAAAVSAFGAHIDDIVRRLDHIEIVLDDDDRVPAFGQPAKDLGQLMDICKVQAGSRLIQDIDGLSRAVTAQLGRQLDALRFAAREGRGWLAQFDVGQSHIIEGLELAAHGRHTVEKAECLFYRHIQHFIDIFPLVINFQSLTVVTLAVADLARHIDIRQEMHLDLDDTVSCTCLTSAALHIEAEAAFFVSSFFGIFGRSKEFSDHIEYPCVGCRIGTGRTPDRGLINIDDLVQLIHAFDSVMLSGSYRASPVQFSCQSLVYNFIDQRALSGTGYTGHTGHNAKRNIHIDMFEIILCSPFDM